MPSVTTGLLLLCTSHCCMCPFSDWCASVAAVVHFSSSPFISSSLHFFFSSPLISSHFQWTFNFLPLAASSHSLTHSLGRHNSVQFTQTHCGESEIAFVCWRGSRSKWCSSSRWDEHGDVTTFGAPFTLINDSYHHHHYCTGHFRSIWGGEEF